MAYHKSGQYQYSGTQPWREYFLSISVILLERINETYLDTRDEPVFRLQEIFVREPPETTQSCLQWMGYDEKPINQAQQTYQYPEWRVRYSTCARESL